MCEDAPCCGCCGPQGDGDWYGNDEYQGREDDLADFNDSEADDYRNEGEDDSYGGEDSHLDGMSEE